MREILDKEIKEGENTWDGCLRPLSFDEFPGQSTIKEKLRIFVQAAKSRNEALDHVLLCGPPGLGKTTLSHIIAREFNTQCIASSGPALDKKGDLAAILTGLKPFSIFFIDEIHRIPRHVEEYLYSAMEDFTLDIVTGEGFGAKTMKFQLSPFTLVGATTRPGLLNAPFRDRFGIVERLEFYSVSELLKIVLRSAKIMNLKIFNDGALEIAKRCRGTPRIANRLLKRVRDYAQIKGDGSVTEKVATYALKELDVDVLGLDTMDRRILHLICNKFSGGPVGIETICAALSEDRETIEDIYEPYLLQEGLLLKTPRGRMVTELAQKHISENDLPGTA